MAGGWALPVGRWNFQYKSDRHVSRLAKSLINDDRHHSMWVERAKNRVSESGAVNGCTRKPWSGCRVRSGRVMEHERSSERTKLAGKISLKGDASLLRLCKSVLPDVKNKLSTRILIPISNWCDIPYILFHTWKTALHGSSPCAASCEWDSVLNF